MTAVPLDVAAEEILRGAFLAATEEASQVVVRSSHSTFVQEGADACAALLDRDGQLIAQSVGTSLIHSASLRACLPHMLTDIPLDELRPGDVLACNDPYRGGIHANDIVVFRPVFLGGRAEFFAGTLVHVADIGGAFAGGLAATARDVFHEGLQLPPVHLVEAGEPIDVVWRILEANSRTPTKLIGDVHALVAGTEVLARRIVEQGDRWGVAAVTGAAQRWLDYADARTREALAALPDGTWTGSYGIESDGVTATRDFEVQVAVTITGDTCRMDFAGTSAQSGGAINSSVSQSLSGAVFALRCFLDPEIPMNEGCLRVLDIELPEGSLVNPRPPAACGGRVVTVAAAIEAVIEAMSGACPDRAVAASGLVHVFTMATTTREKQWLALLYDFGGLGAGHGLDGADATGAFFLGGRSVVPQIEPLEVGAPLYVRHIRLRPDSGGAGTWRGGRGVETELVATEDVTVTVRGDRIVDPPRGRDGGLPGEPGYFAVTRGDGTVEHLAPKEADVHLHAGDALIVATSGGGGLGTPTSTTDGVAR